MFRARRKRSREVSLYEPIGTDREGNEISLLDIIESPPVDVVDDCFKRDSISYLLRYIRTVLSPKEYQVICCRYGLNGQEPLTSERLLKISPSAAPMYPVSKRTLFENSVLFFLKISKGENVLFVLPFTLLSTLSDHSPLRRISNTSGISVSFT